MAFADIFLVALSALSLTNFLLYEATLTTEKFDPETCQTSICQESARYLLDSMDTSVDPCDDFYRYACGGWIDKHPIPEGKSLHSVFDFMADEIYKAMAGVVVSATRKDQPKPVRDAATLFMGCIDERARKAQGTKPLKHILNVFGGWPIVNPDWSDAGYQWYKEVASVRRTLGIDVILGIEVDQMNWQPSRNIIYLSRGDFGLGSKHLENLTSSDTTREIVDAYKEFIMSSAKLLNPNIDEIALSNDAEEIIQFESALAQDSWMGNETEKTEAKRTNDPWYDVFMDFVERKITKEPPKETMTVSALQRATDNEYFQWTNFLNVVFQEFPEVTDSTEIALQERYYIKHALKVISETDPRIVANYIGWILVQKIGDHTTKDFRENEFGFKKVMNSTQEPPKLVTACANEVNELMGFAVSRLYVDNYFSEEAKHDAEAIVEDIRSAYEINLNHNAWMDPETKNKALEKLRNMVHLVGYPSWIKNDTELSDYYSAVQVKQKEYFASFVTAKTVSVAKSLEIWNQPVERTKWNNFPSEVNAYYYMSMNTMVFPAGILNPPFYKYGRSPALNYGGFGATVGHEISHGFDNDGMLYDKDGNLENWWSKETGDKFREKADCLEKQYSSFVEPMTNMSVNGAMTLGDNIADNGGARNAFMAYKLKILQAQENEVIPNLKLPGLSATPEQLFFLGLANGECASYTEESMKYTIETNDHAPSEYRVLGPLSNSKAFAEAFNCPVGSRMNPEAKCHLW